MIKLLKQLFIERLLSGARPYIAFHPELGVRIGVFNYKDEPDYQSRVRSIKQYGTKGNPLSYKIAQNLGILNPIPSYTTADDVATSMPDGTKFKHGGKWYIAHGGKATESTNLKI